MFTNVQTQQNGVQNLLEVKSSPSREDILRGGNTPLRTNNDLLSYHLDIRVDPDKKFIQGKNTIRFKMLDDADRIQLDLDGSIDVDKILFENGPLKYERDSGAVFVNFPTTLQRGKIYAIDFYFSGSPKEVGRFGAFTFKRDFLGFPWITTACEDEGASMWWPNKDQWRDEVENMEITVSVPNDLVAVSNGKFLGKKELGDGYTSWNWLVQYPINNYDVALNIGNYKHFEEHYGKLPLDFYALPQDLEKAQKQFEQSKEMLAAFEHYFGPYPFEKDGYKLIQVPYSGMEHQSAVSYGNGFTNGYLGKDWTGVGISPKFDFIIIHESAHEWFGNSVSAADRSDMWIHEAWATYLESLYVEYRWGKQDALRYLSGYRPKVKNRVPIIGPRGVNSRPSDNDQYFKGALFLNTLRSVIDDDHRWFKLIRDYYQHYKYQNIMTEDVTNYFNQKTGMNLTPIFNQYLRHTAIPRLELKFDESHQKISYRWVAGEQGFAMPIRIGKENDWKLIRPTTTWQTISSSLTKEATQVATDLYFVDVVKE